MTVLLRAEARDTERRTPLMPADAARLVAAGMTVQVERSPRRIVEDAAYAQAGCTLVEARSWMNAAPETLILGVKELPDHPKTLSGTYAHFAHLYKDQRGWRDELARFRRGGGTLYDLEYLTGDTGARVAAFGYWAGWLGAALAVRGWCLRERGTKAGPVEPCLSRDAVIEDIRALHTGTKPPRAIIIGAKGRSGQGASDLFDTLDIPATRWDKEETASLDRAALLDHDILVNCVLLHGPGLTLATDADLSDPATRLGVISDVACDPLSDFNPLPVYDAPTGWAEPFLRVGRDRHIWLTAIDNLPSLLPREASEDFSAQLWPSLQSYPDGIAWRNARSAFETALHRAETAPNKAPGDQIGSP